MYFENLNLNKLELRNDEEGVLNLVNVSKEIHIIIFLFLGPKHLLNIFLVNKSFHESANDDNLWYIKIDSFTNQKATIL